MTFVFLSFVFTGHKESSRKGGGLLGGRHVNIREEVVFTPFGLHGYTEWILKQNVHVM